MAFAITEHWRAELVCAALRMAVAEAWFSTLTTELVYRIVLPTKAAARRRIIDWIDRYHRTRLSHGVRHARRRTQWPRTRHPQSPPRRTHVTSYRWDATTIGPLLRAMSAAMRPEIGAILARDRAPVPLPRIT